MTIFISYPMYFDALRRNINSKNQKSIIKWSFWPQNWSFSPKSAGDRQIEGNAQILGQNDHLMIIFWFFALIFVISAPKHIGYDMKIVTFRTLFFRPLLENNKKRKNFIHSVHDRFRDHRLIKIIHQKNLVKVIDWKVFALNYTRFRFLGIFWNCVRFWSFFVENGILRGY